MKILTIDYDLLRVLEIGKSVGLRLYEISLWRDKSSKRENQLLNVLFYVTNSFWKLICGRNADSLERSTDNENECNSSFMRDFLFYCLRYDI